MLKNIPAIISPDLLKAMDEMGHGDHLCIGDSNFPGPSTAKAGQCIFLRLDGHGIPEVMDAILQLFPLDTYTEHPVMLMDKMECDKDMVLPVWDKYAEVVGKYDSRGKDALGFYERYEFYDRAQECYVIVQTSETSDYANVILQKGLVKNK